MITLSIANDTAGSVRLSQKRQLLKDGSVGTVSIAKVRNLLAKGSGDFIAEEKLSKFGNQTGEAHGGLLFSRSPTQFFHSAVGQFRDVDLSGCYASILGQMYLYAGRPVIREPGPGKMRLKDAVAFVREHAAGWDGWIIKATGPITCMPNVLIPSTSNALTHANYQNRVAKKRTKSKRYGFWFDWLYQVRKATGNAALYTDVVEAGIIAWPTWLMIQALPRLYARSTRISKLRRSSSTRRKWWPTTDRSMTVWSSSTPRQRHRGPLRSIWAPCSTLLSSSWTTTL